MSINMQNRFFQRYHKLELLIIGIFLASIVIVVASLGYLCPEKFNEIVFSFGSCVAFVLVLFLLGTYLVAPHLFRNLMALISKQKIENIVGPIINNDKEIEKPWEQKKDLAISKHNQALQIAEKEDRKNPKIEEVVTAFKQHKYLLVISAKEEILSSGIDKKDEAFYRFLLEMSYNEIEEYDIEERISNLSILFYDFKQNFPPSLFIAFQCNLAQLYVRQNKIEEATNLLVDIFNHVNKKEYKLSNDQYARINDLQSTILLKKRHPALALSYLKRAWSYSTESSWYEFKIARIYCYKLYIPEKALEYAKNAFSHLKEEETDLYEALVNMCFYLEAFLGNYQEAYQYIDSSNIKDDRILACKAYILTKLGRYDEALHLTQSVIDRDPSQVTAFNAKGIVHLQRKEYTTAERCFTFIIPEFEKDKDIYAKYYTAEIYYNRGICNLKLRNLKQAILDFRRAEKLGYIDFEANYLDIIQKYFLEHNEKKSAK